MKNQYFIYDEYDMFIGEAETLEEGIRRTKSLKDKHPHGTFTVIEQILRYKTED